MQPFAPHQPPKNGKTFFVFLLQTETNVVNLELPTSTTLLFEKIFGYRWSQSVSNLQSFLSRPTWEKLVERRKNGFVARLIHNGGDSLARAALS